ncbi:MAG: hypothetical protein KGZ74_19700 [Chitinophagaceae bacterium]|nr:hypothetical protein [Chitinophagaceae bacterium]
MHGWSTVGLYMVSGNCVVIILYKINYNESFFQVFHHELVIVYDELLQELMIEEALVHVRL